MTAKIRIQIESAIAKAALVQAITSGYAIGVAGIDGGNDAFKLGDNEFEYLGRNVDACFAAMMQADEDRIYFFAEGELARARAMPDEPLARPDGLQFVYGNDGWDCISDYSRGAEAIISGALAMGERISEGEFSIVMNSPGVGRPLHAGEMVRVTAIAHPEQGKVGPLWVLPGDKLAIRLHGDERPPVWRTVPVTLEEIMRATPRG